MPTPSPADLVQLPRLTASAARALGRQLLAAAAAHKSFPKSLIKPQTQLAAAHADLESALVAQFGESTLDTPDDSPSIQELDRILDNCWSALDDRLRGLTKLPSSFPAAAEATPLRKRLFPAGLTFLKLPFKLQWSESQTRLDLIDRDSLASSIDDLAGKPFLTAIRKAHANYGAALGMSKPLSVPATPTQVRGSLAAFSEAVRTYVVKVIAHVDADTPSTQATADALLGPLTRWVSTPRRPTDPSDGAADDAAGAPADDTAGDAPGAGVPAGAAGPAAGAPPGPDA
ncbi:MAG: hypothetical protein R3B70_06285 [Polyangiaceae bacterium]